MKCNPLRWLWGIIPILALSWLAVQFEHERIENELTQQVKRNLRGAGLDWAAANFSGRDGVLTGKAQDASEQGKADSLVNNIWGVRTLDDKSELISKADNYHWSASRGDNRVHIAGHVPSIAAREMIAKIVDANFPGETIDYKMELARGAPPMEPWLDGIAFALKQLAFLKSGEVRLDGLDLSIAGEAADIASYRGVKAALASHLPRGLKLTKDAVTAPMVKPYIWSARYAGNQLLLSGYAPSERVREELLRAAKVSLPRALVTDRMEIAEGALPGFTAALITTLKELARLEEGSAELKDTALSFTGQASDESTAESVRRNLRAGLSGSVRLSDQIKFREPVIKPVMPYMTSAMIDAGSVVLTGKSPSAEAREAVAQDARTRFPGRHVDNRLEISAGAQEGWQHCMDSGLFGLGLLGGGRLALTDRRMEISGATDDEALAESLPGQIRSVLGHECEAIVHIERLAANEPEIEWRALYNGHEVVLEGEVVGAVKSELTQAAAQLFKDTRIVDHTRGVDSPIKDWPRAAHSGLAMLAQLKRGEVRLAKHDLSVAGEAESAATAMTIREQLNHNLPKGYRGHDAIEVRAQPPSTDTETQRKAAARACQEELRNAADEGIIRFHRARADIDHHSYATLNRLASIAKSCPNFNIEIEGHTDAQGTPARNQRLSDRRANAVMAYLIRAGVDATRLQPIGYGESRPIVPNDTAENRAKNRRIEFTVRAN
jgi:outer membrane protein OmpA-like peptidoglycan-associated protein